MKREKNCNYETRKILLWKIREENGVGKEGRLGLTVWEEKQTRFVLALPQDHSDKLLWFGGVCHVHLHNTALARWPCRHIRVQTMLRRTVRQTNSTMAVPPTSIYRISQQCWEFTHSSDGSIKPTTAPWFVSCSLGLLTDLYKKNYTQAHTFISTDERKAPTLAAATQTHFLQRARFAHKSLPCSTDTSAFTTSTWRSEQQVSGSPSDCLNTLQHKPAPSAATLTLLPFSLASGDIVKAARM